MGYRLIGENDLLNPREQILKNRNITEELLNVGEEVIEDCWNYDNMDKACELLTNHIEKHSKIAILCDEDYDGVVSTTIMRRYLREYYNTETQVLIHGKTKAHGITKDVDIPLDIQLLIVPDASSNNQEEIKNLEEKGIDVLVIDHHPTTQDLKYGIIVNNQCSDKIKNKHLCGSGVVYKFICAMSEYNYMEEPTEYMDLNALANIADVMLMTSPETRYYTYKGLNNIINPFLKALIEVKRFEIDGKEDYVISHSFNTIPLINAVVREGTMEDKRKVVEAFCSDDYEFCLKVANDCKRIKQKQDNRVKTSTNKITRFLKIKNEDRIIIADGMSANTSETGLIASKLSTNFKLPTILYHNYNGICRGSCRGLEGITLKEDLLSSGLMEFAEGHSNASGVAFKFENLEPLKEYMNNLYKDIDFGNSNCYDVDFEIYDYEVDQEFVNEVAEFEREVSKGIDWVLVAIKDVELYLNSSNEKGKLNVVFDVCGVECIKKFTSKVWKEQYMNKKIHVDLICKCCINPYNKMGRLELVDLEEI